MSRIEGTAEKNCSASSTVRSNTSAILFPLNFIYNVSQERGGHRHKKTKQAFICLGGSCEIYINNGIIENKIILDSPNKCLIVEAEDWHTMDKFSPGSTLLVLASEYYLSDDYIDEAYK